MSKVYFITGASSGFGRELAEEVLERGDRAVLCARRKDELKEIAEPYGDAALVIKLDVKDGIDRESAVEKALDHFGRIDVLANIAGHGSVGAAEEFSAEQLSEQMSVNFFAATQLTRAVLPAMREQKRGHILNLTSIGGLTAGAGFSLYCASKFALEGWSESLSAEVKPLGIAVTIIEPGAFRTEFAGDAIVRPEKEIDAYNAVIEPVEKYIFGNDGKQPGDPHKAALAMIAVIESKNPPLRLLLGKDALERFEKKQKQLQAEMAEWRETSEGTAFDDARASEAA